MRLLLFCEQTGVRLDPTLSASACAKLHDGCSQSDCPLMSERPEGQVKPNPWDSDQNPP